MSAESAMCAARKVDEDEIFNDILGQKLESLRSDFAADVEGFMEKIQAEQEREREERRGQQELEREERRRQQELERKERERSFNALRYEIHRPRMSTPSVCLPFSRSCMFAVN